jgi:hypothetical protein
LKAADVEFELPERRISRMKIPDVPDVSARHQRDLRAAQSG